MRRACALLLSGALVASSCGGSSDTDSPVSESTSAVTAAPGVSEAPTESPAPPETPVTEPSVTEPPVTEPPVTEPPISADPVTITSDDGDLFITLPGDVAAELGVSIRRLEPSELPPEVAGGDNLDSVKVYELEPDGATFDEPVTVTRRLDVAAFDFLALGPDDVPFVTSLNRDSSGTYGLLDDLTMTRLGDDLLLSGTTTHFSSFVASNEGTVVRRTGRSRTAAEGLESLDGFDATRAAYAALLREAIAERVDPLGVPDAIQLFLDRTLPVHTYLGTYNEGIATAAAFSLLFDEDATPVAPPTVTVESTPLDADTGVVATTQTSTFDIPIDNAPSASALTDGNADQPTSIEYAVRTFGAQVPASLFPEPFLSGLRPVGTVDTNHTALELYASFLRVLLRGLGNLSADDRLFLAIRDAGPLGGDSQFVDIRPLDVLADGSTIVDLGIECFCEYELLMFYLAAADDLAAQALAEATTLDEALAIVGAQENIARLAFESSPDVAAVFGVGFDEGPIVEDVQLALQLLALE